jgi:hypothetical protein
MKHKDIKHSIVQRWGLSASGVNQTKPTKGKGEVGVREKNKTQETIAIK